MIAAPILIMRFKIKPRNTPIVIEKRNEKIVLSVDKSWPYCANSILSIKKSSMVIPNPAIPPVAKIVISKKSFPKKATTRPNKIVRSPKICGLLIKNLAKVVTENTGHAFEFVPTMTGAQISSVFTLRAEIAELSS